MRKFLVASFIVFSSSLLRAENAEPPAEPLNANLKPEDINLEDNLFEDMVVVQKKAMNKSGRFLLSSYASLDFSDGPYTLWAWNVNPGFALSDFWEVYVSFAPVYISQERDIVKKIKGIGGTIDAQQAKYSYGVELLWSPLYGKDSLGSRHVIRSDTFVKLGVHNIQYDKGNGYKIHTAIGKTYFISNHLGFRPAISGNMIQTIVDNKKEFRFFAIVEAGLVAYF
jgi:outer membrane beta-barrel protein